MPDAAALETVPQVVGIQQVVAGITTAPSLIAASMISHSGTTLPSISRITSPRAHPEAAQEIGGPIGAFRHLGEAQPGLTAGLIDHPQGDAVVAPGHGVEIVERPVEMDSFGQRKPR